MAGLNVVPVACDERGNIDLGDLEAKAQQHREKLAALMITYPSTHGVFEESVRRVCRIVHDYGGRGFLGGGHINAPVGLFRRGGRGADVCPLYPPKNLLI